jgi:hypothetical protein
LDQNIPHIPVLFNETIDAFKDCNEGYIIDCTLGYGGHSQGILEKYPKIKLICNDQDDTALEFSKKRLEKFKDRIIFNKGNFQTVLEKFKDKMTIVMKENDVEENIQSAFWKAYDDTYNGKRLPATCEEALQAVGSSKQELENKLNNASTPHTDGVL